MLLNNPTFEIQELTSPLFIEKKIRLFVARLDKIHPVVSGNKIFKLHYFINNALDAKINTIKTFGGAYSNHLVATAYLCNEAGLNSIGMVRGEKPTQLSHTLQQCLSYNMKLNFIRRKAYAEISIRQTEINKNENHLTIPEGGFHPLGANGAALILNQLKELSPSHICTAVGTATTLAGLIKNQLAQQKIIGIPVVKNLTDLQTRIEELLEQQPFETPVIFDQYHFGGYAKKTHELLNFMNEFYKSHQIPTDFVYTAKAMFGIFDQINKSYFPENSKIVFLHTGGLQGNLSLPPGTLIF